MLISTCLYIYITSCALLTRSPITVQTQRLIDENVYISDSILTCLYKKQAAPCSRLFLEDGADVRPKTTREQRTYSVKEEKSDHRTARASRWAGDVVGDMSLSDEESQTALCHGKYIYIYTHSILRRDKKPLEHGPSEARCW